MRSSRWTTVVVATVLAVTVGPFAAAAPPVKTPVPFEATFPGYTGACAFPITVTFDTHQTQRDWSDSSGVASQTHLTGKGTVTISNDTNAHSVTVGASGPTIGAHGKTKGTGHWVLIGRTAMADMLPFPPGVWLYTGQIADLDATDYSQVFSGRVTDLCAAVA